MLSGHSGAVRAVAVHPDGSRLYSGSADRTVREWSTVGGPRDAGPPDPVLTTHNNEARAPPCLVDHMLQQTFAPGLGVIPARDGSFLVFCAI